MDEGLTATYPWAERRVKRLEQMQARQGAYTQPDYQWNFRVSPSCPPSTVVHMRGGTVWGDWGAGWDGESWYVDSASYDLADIADTGNTKTFTNAYYYRCMSVMLRGSGHPGVSPPLYIWGNSLEYATGAEAEAAAYPEWADGRFDAYAAYGIPLAIVIMRNNGNTSLVNQYLPVDRVNRGRGYIWRNLKVRFQWG